MDPASVAMVVSLVYSIYGEISSSIIGNFKNKTEIKIEKAANDLRNILSRAYSLNSDKAQILENKLANLNFIRKTPALKKAVESMSLQLNSRKKEIYDDQSRLQKIEMDHELAVEEAKAEDGGIPEIKRAKNNYYNKKGELTNEAEEILKKYQEKR